MSATPLAFALNGTQAAIATPGFAPSLCVLGFGQSVNVSGTAALAALREAIDHALATSGEEKPGLTIPQAEPLER